MGDLDRSKNLGQGESMDRMGAWRYRCSRG